MPQQLRVFPGVWRVCVCVCTRAYATATKPLQMTLLKNIHQLASTHKSCQKILRQPTFHTVSYTWPQEKSTQISNRWLTHPLSKDHQGCDDQLGLEQDLIRSSTQWSHWCHLLNMESKMWMLKGQRVRSELVSRGLSEGGSWFVVRSYLLGSLFGS